MMATKDEMLFDFVFGALLGIIVEAFKGNEGHKSRREVLAAVLTFVAVYQLYVWNILHSSSVRSSSVLAQLAVLILMFIIIAMAALLPLLDKV